MRTKNKSILAGVALAASMTLVACTPGTAGGGGAEPGKPSAMPAGLREQLIGAWKLESYREVPTDGSEPFEPLGPNPQGIIMYTPDGYMSAQLSAPDRPPFASGDWFNATDEEYKAEATTYIAYTGPFKVDEQARTLEHSMFISLFPNWTGQTQPRVVTVEGDTLTLAPAKPIMSSGKEVMSQLVWRRAEAN